MDKLPAHPGVSYRGTNLPPDVLARYQLGSIVSDKAFTSTSVDIGVARDFGPVDLTIDGRTGAAIEPLSNLRREAEVLYRPGAEFRVLTRQVDPVTGRLRIELQEVTR